MWYTDSLQSSNLILDLIFLYMNTKKFNNHIILLDLWKLFNHTLLSIYIIIKEEVIQDRKLAIVKNSKKEKKFVNDLRNRIEYINKTNICSHNIPQKFTFIAEELWYKHSKYVNITKHSKAWWNKEYNRDWTIYQTSRRRIDWIKYRKTVKIAKQIFFDNRKFKKLH